MRKSMFERLIDKGLTKEREDLAQSVAERLKDYILPAGIEQTELHAEGNPHAIDVYTPVRRGADACETEAEHGACETEAEQGACETEAEQGACETEAACEADEAQHGAAADGTYPALINIHGGGLVLGSNLQNKQYCAHMAERGYIVCAVDYSLVPEVQAMTQLDEIACGFNAIMDYLAGETRWNGKVYATGDSAGAWLLMQTCVIAANPNIAAAWGVTRAKRLPDKVAFYNGMFYSTRKDKIGMLAGLFFGKGYAKKAFATYLNPELPEMINSLPPFFMMTSVNDYLRGYSVDFARAASKVRSDFVFRDYEEFESLGHADAATRPFGAEAMKVNDDVDEFLRDFSQ